MSGLFATLNTGRSGLNVSQTTIDCTSHNIANVNTTGYSRQRAAVVTSRPSSAYSYGQVGTGAEVQTIERVRDSFLDYQVRNQNTSLGKDQIISDNLSEIESIYNEPTDSGISTLVGNFFDAWQELSKNPSSSSVRTSVVQQAATLAGALNTAYTKLENLQTDAQTVLRNNAVDVNSELNQLNKLNGQIKSVTASGQTPNDLMDQRDNILDDLSKMFGITVDNTNYNGINVSTADNFGMVSSAMVTSDGTNIGARLSYVSSIDVDPTDSTCYKISYYKNGDSTSAENLTSMKVKITSLSDDQKADILQSRLILANEDGEAVKADGSAIDPTIAIDGSQLMVFKPSSGEIAGNQTIQTKVQNYKDELDKVAKALAFSVNAIHSGDTTATETSAGSGIYYSETDLDTTPFFVNSSVASYDSNHNLTNLSTTLGKENQISAKTISVNEDLLNNVTKLNTKQTSTNGSGDGTRALAIAQLRNTLMDIQDIGTTINSREDFRYSTSSTFSTATAGDGMVLTKAATGATVDDYFQNIISKLGIQSKESQRQVSNETTMLTSTTNSRLSVSGVSLDEEMSNLIQYQHAYSANAKIISTVDELLDVVINGLKK